MSRDRDEEAKNVKLFDVRVIDRNIKKGVITRRDYDKYLKTLPDSADKVAPADSYPADEADDDMDDDLDSTGN